VRKLLVSPLSDALKEWKINCPQGNANCFSNYTFHKEEVYVFVGRLRLLSKSEQWNMLKKFDGWAKYC